MTKTYQKLRSRIGLLSFFIIFSWISLTSRLFQVMIIDSEKYQKKSAEKTTRNKQIAPYRGNIFDRNNVQLTRNVTHYDVGVHPQDIKEKKAFSHMLSEHFGENFEYYISKVNSNSNYKTIHTKVTKDKIKSLLHDTPKGLKIDRYARRVYPHSNIVGQIVGFSDKDDIGLTGIEKTFNKELTGLPGWEVKKVDRKGRSHYNNNLPKKPAINGSNIKLSIDIEYQSILIEELKRRKSEMNAKGAIGILANPQNGKILAMASLPDFDPNFRDKFPIENQKNKAIVDLFEPGSIYKIVTSTAALNSKTVDILDEFYCEDGEYKFADNVISDHKSYGLMTFSEIFAHSSNIGMVKVAKELGPGQIYKYSRDFGFGSTTGISFPGEAKGILRSVNQWSDRSIIGVPIGYEVGVTALQMIMAYSAIANGGYLLKPIIVDQIISPENNAVFESKIEVIRKIASKSTMKKMKNMLGQAVDYGTGRKAKIDGWSVAGKTGTAYKFIDGKYSKNFISNFIGFFPKENPQIVGIVIIDDPKPNNGMHTGGDVAAPAFRRIASRLINLDDSIQFYKPKNQKKMNTIIASLSSIEKYEKYTDGYSIMPNVRGMSLLKAKRILINANIYPKIIGSGTVVWQSPKPGSKINPESKCEIGLR